LRSLAVAFLVGVGAATPSAVAQDLPPGHPPVAPEGEAEEPAEGDLPAGHPPVGGAEVSGPPRSPHAGGRGDIRLPADDSHDAVEEDRNLPPGTIVVDVVDPEARGVADQPVEIVVLAADQSRRKIARRTDADGRVRLAGLQRGSDQAYRVYAPYRGARYGAEPFQLSEEGGTRVTITRWPVTSSVEKLLLFRGRFFVEFGEEGMQITGHSAFMNVGGEAIVPRGGAMRIPLPAGARAFNAQQMMTDQRLTMDDSEGHEAVLVAGSFPPGQTALFYRFQLPVDDSEVEIEYRLPFKTIIYEVIVEKTPKMRLDVDGMEDPEEHELPDGRAVLATALQRRPGSPAFSNVRIRIEGLPGKGPGRWIALALVLSLCALGVRSFLSGGETEKVRSDARSAERERLLGLAAALERDRGAGKVADDDAYRRRRDRIVGKLAEIYRAETAG
jgi:hypothetical protein